MRNQTNSRYTVIAAKYHQVGRRSQYSDSRNREDNIISKS